MVLSGVIGRFIYIQIPRSVEGRELSLNELCVMKAELTDIISESSEIEGDISGILQDAFANRPDSSRKNIFAKLFNGYRYDRAIFKKLKRDLKKKNLTRANYKKACKLLSNEISLNRKIDMLNSMRNLMEYWHVAHLPFALAMLVVMLIHVGVVLTLGYKWIF